MHSEKLQKGCHAVHQDKISSRVKEKISQRFNQKSSDNSEGAILQKKKKKRE